MTTKWENKEVAMKASLVAARWLARLGVSLKPTNYGAVRNGTCGDALFAYILAHASTIADMEGFKCPAIPDEFARLTRSTPEDRSKSLVKALRLLWLGDGGSEVQKSLLEAGVTLTDEQLAEVTSERRFWYE